MSMEAAPPEDRRSLVAVDLGAESCRVSLLRWHGDVPKIDLINRFANGPVRHEDGRLRWPLAQIIEGVEEGLRMCAAASPEAIRSVAVDGWAVDYVRLDATGALLDEPFCYRDERNINAERELHTRIAPERLREITGIQLQSLNTVYQLRADRLAALPAGQLWLNLPEYLLRRWGGAPVAEFTNATHTGLVELDSPRWSREILDAAELDPATMPTLVPPGSLLGHMEGPLAKLPAFQHTELIAPACHDTASAVAGIPANGDDWAYISSGTWSLVGTVLQQSCNRPSVRSDGFTNLGGIGHSVCFHRNVNGMWILKQCMNAWVEAGWPWEINDLVRQAERVAAPPGLLDVDDPQLLLLGHMPARINRQRRERGLSPVDESPQAAPAMTRLVLEGLAARYAEVLRGVEQHTGKHLKRLYVVGGGSRNKLLQRLTAEATGLEVHCGAAESSTIGNFAVQLAALEEAGDPSQKDFADAVSRWAATLLKHATTL